MAVDPELKSHVVWDNGKVAAWNGKMLVEKRWCLWDGSYARGTVAQRHPWSAASSASQESKYQKGVHLAQTCRWCYLPGELYLIDVAQVRNLIAQLERWLKIIAEILFWPKMLRMAPPIWFWHLFKVGQLPFWTFLPALATNFPTWVRNLPDMLTAQLFCSWHNGRYNIGGSKKPCKQGNFIISSLIAM